MSNDVKNYSKQIELLFDRSINKSTKPRKSKNIFERPITRSKALEYSNIQAMYDEIIPQIIAIPVLEMYTALEVCKIRKASFLNMINRNSCLSLMTLSLLFRTLGRKITITNNE
jgi:hypothetical protein